MTLAGTGLAGVLGEAIGIRPTLFLGVAAAALGGLCLLVSPVSRLRDTAVPGEGRVVGDEGGSRSARTEIEP